MKKYFVIRGRFVNSYLDEYNAFTRTDSTGVIVRC